MTADLDARYGPCAEPQHDGRASYPERPITLIVPWGAGGGTDATGRILASMMEKELGVPVSVVNRTRGTGRGRSFRRSRSRLPDGYTLGVVMVEIGIMHWKGVCLERSRGGVARPGV